MRVERILRRVAPSIVRLSYNPIFKRVIDLFDVVPGRFYREFREIPPNHLRVRVGVGNRLFANQVGYLTWPTNFWLHVFHAGLCRLNSTIVDIGCGCGRYAYPLRDYRFKAETFCGSYIGIDVDDEMLTWCRGHFDERRFSFYRTTHLSSTYGPSAPSSSERDLPNYYLISIADKSVDFVFSISLFTHLLEPELINYFKESYRILRDNHYMLMNCFSIDHPPPTFGNRHTFSHMIGHAYVESQRFPEAAVAYKESFLLELAMTSGFQSAEFVLVKNGWQPALLCRK